MQAIQKRTDYNTLRKEAHIRNILSDTTLNIDNFEENILWDCILWDWISINYHISHEFIYEYYEKLDMQYLYDNFVITSDEFEKIRNKEKINNRFEILDIRGKEK